MLACIILHNMIVEDEREENNRKQKNNDVATIASACPKNLIEYVSSLGWGMGDAFDAVQRSV